MRFVVAFAVFLAGCAGTSSKIFPLRNVYDQRIAVIFIPGIYGTALKEKDSGERRFVTFQQFFGDRFSLALYQKEMKTPESVPLVPEGIIGSINAVPFLKEFGGYEEALDFLQHGLDDDVQLFPFAYDWRLDLHTQVVALDQLVEKIRAEGAPEIYIVAHSMGGLIAAHYLRYGTAENPTEDNWDGARKVDRVVFAGVPWLGSMSIFRNMQIGAPLYWNNFLLSQEAVSSFPSSYFLLPYPTCNLIDHEGKEIEKSLFDFWLWNNYDWGLLKEEDFLDAKYRNARDEFTKKWLEAGKHWFDDLHAPVKTPPPRVPILNIVGTGRYTLAKAYWVVSDKKLLFRDWDIENYDKSLPIDDLFSDGDETVTTPSATLPAAWKQNFKYEEMQTSDAHGMLLNGAAVQKRISQFLKNSPVP